MGVSHQTVQGEHLRTMRAAVTVLFSLALLGVSSGLPFSESQYGQLLRNLHKRSAQLSGYGGSQGSAPASDYGAASAPACRTEYKQECNTVNEQVCNTVKEQQCSTVNEQQCSTVNEQVCNTVQEQQCNT